MKLNSFDEVKKITEEMVAIPSINKEPEGETKVAKYVYDYYMSLDYFRENPERAKMFKTKNDFVDRHSTYAYVKGTKGNSGRTVILIGHIDTVGVDDFGTIREYAFKCRELPEKLKETFKLSREVIDDIESGEYMFGRGALDAHILTDDDGRKYLFFSSAGEDNVIDGEKYADVEVIRLSDDMMRTEGEPARIIRCEEPYEKRNTDLHQYWAEGPSVVKHDGIYHLMYSVNFFASRDYSICVAESRHPEGP